MIGFILWCLFLYLVFCIFRERKRTKQISSPIFVDQQAIANYIMLMRMAHTLDKVNNDELIAIAINPLLKQEIDSLVKEFYKR